MAFNQKSEISKEIERMGVTKEEFSAFSSGISEDIHTKYRSLKRSMKIQTKKSVLGQVVTAIILLSVILFALSMSVVLVSAAVINMINSDTEIVEHSPVTTTETIPSMVLQTFSNYFEEIARRQIEEQLAPPIAVAIDTQDTFTYPGRQPEDENLEDVYFDNGKDNEEYSYDTTVIEPDIDPETAAAMAEVLTLEPTQITHNFNDLTHKSGFTAEEFDTIINAIVNDPTNNHMYYKPHSKWINHGQALYDMEQTYDINGIFALAVSGIESGYGTVLFSNNMYGMIGCRFASTYDGTQYFGKLIREEYVNKGLTTITLISRKYCNAGWIGPTTAIYNQVVRTASQLYPNP